MSGNSFKENVAVITGASTGIGKELALQLAKRGALVVLASRDENKLNEVALECQRLGGKAIAVKTDVSDKTQCKNLIEKAVAEYGRIDSLFNNAGITMWAKFEEVQDIDMFEKIMKVNYLGSVYCTYFALPHLKKSKGRLIAISSLTGKTGVPTRSGYAASKHAMAGFFDSLRIELANSGVTVSVIYPGFVSTEVREHAFGADGKQLGKSHVQEEKVMTVDKCAQLIIRTAAKRKRELVMTPRAKVGMWIKLISPKLVDKISAKAIRTGH